MRRIRYAVAMSLDGYIAGPQGEADWIFKPDDPTVAMKFFTEFFPQFDIAIMGRRAYEVFGGAVQGMDTYVFSRTLPPGKREGVTVLGADGLTRLRELREGSGKDIWLFGGGSLFGSLASAGLVDCIELGGDAGDAGRRCAGDVGQHLSPEAAPHKLRTWPRSCIGEIRPQSRVMLPLRPMRSRFQRSSEPMLRSQPSLANRS